MLAISFPPLPYFRTPSFDEMFEALCLCNLAKYPVETLTARCVDSFKRAWGMTTIYSFPADANGTPGWKVAEWVNVFAGGPASRKLVVAIDGITDLADAGIFDLGPSAYYSFQGRVKTRWKLYADTIEPILANNFGLDQTANRINTQITFAGWSAGASTAELLAFRFNAQYHFPAVKLFTFGKPQTGNARWNAFRATRVQRQNLLLIEDPICTLPGGGQNAQIFSQTSSINANLCPDPDVLVYKLDGFNNGGYSHRQLSYAITTLLSYALSYSDTFYNHDRRRYLTTCAHFCEGLYDSLALRILDAEFPDANNVLANWRHGNRPVPRSSAGRWDELFAFEEGDPGDNLVPIEVQRQLNLLPSPRPIITQTTARQDTDGTRVNGDWGNTPPGPRTAVNSIPAIRRLRVRR